ncbi:MAG: glutathione S-transferase family protein [Myxococcota bacterium]
MHLVTIAFSHYNDRARWALQHFGVEFRESGYMPMFHVPGVIRAVGLGGGRADRASTRFSTPILITDDGEHLRDSALIVRYLDDRFSTAETTLYPPEHEAEIVEIERRVSERIGPHARRVAYFHLLQRSDLMVAMARDNVGRIQATLFRVLRPLLTAALKLVLRIDPRRVESSMQVIREEIARLDEHLGSRRYLVGDRFTAADLSTACMLAPAIIPSRNEGYGAVLPELNLLSAELRSLVDEMRATAIGTHALRMYGRRVGVTE